MRCKIQEVVPKEALRWRQKHHPNNSQFSQVLIQVLKTIWDLLLEPLDFIWWPILTLLLQYWIPLLKYTILSPFPPPSLWVETYPIPSLATLVPHFDKQFTTLEIVKHEKLISPRTIWCVLKMPSSLDRTQVSCWLFHPYLPITGYIYRYFHPPPATPLPELQNPKLDLLF